jgi:O-acetyl-ADP-ribose deacetylase (regulator of RNase III)
MEWTWEGRTLRLIQGNIALLDVDAVVNAANRNLVLGSGVAGAIRRFGGPTIQAECDRLAPIETGQAVITGGGTLKARFVIHAVGPVAGEGDEDRLLSEATTNSLRIAAEKKLASLAFPAVSTGVFGFPLERCAEIMLGRTISFLEAQPSPRLVVFCLYDENALNVFARVLRKLTAA